jgi:hypothetical protein
LRKISKVIDHGSVRHNPMLTDDMRHREPVRESVIVLQHGALGNYGAMIAAQSDLIRGVEPSRPRIVRMADDGSAED